MLIHRGLSLQTNYSSTMAAVIFESVRDCKMLVQQLERHETQRHESNGNFPHDPFFFLARSFDQLQKFLSAAEFLWVHST